MHTMKTNVVRPLTWKDIDALPIANNDMTEEELRQLCLDFMNMMLIFPWTPSHQTDLISKGKVAKTFMPGEVYGGIPYVAGVMGNLYTMMEYYNEENGMMDLSQGMDTLGQWANQCSGSTMWAWNRVCSSMNFHSTSDMYEERGCLKVGDYAYAGDYEIDDGGYFAEGCGTEIICQQNGEQKIFEAYALVKPADGIISSSQGHVQMISRLPIVKRNEDGTIIGEKSYVFYTDQDGAYYTIAQANGKPYDHVGGYYSKISFKDLIAKHYIPFTFAELNKDKPVDASVTALSHTGKTISLAQLDEATVTCNYCISDITFVVKDEAGKQVLRSLTPLYYKKNTSNIKVGKVSDALANCDLTEFADGKHTIEISARIGTGEKPVVYTGTLVK